MLPKQAGLLAASPDIFDPNGFTRDSGEGKRRAQNLSAAFTLAAVNYDFIFGHLEILF
jgi:hypothetical protein